MAAPPPYLKKGAVVGITCPAGYVSNERVAPAVDLLQLWGFRVKVGETVGNEYGYFSGTDEERLADLQKMLDDPGIDAILMGRGGYGLSRIIDRLDFTKFVTHPKWICGFSDITVLHNHIASLCGIPTFHSPMCAAFRAETAHADFVQSFYAAIIGESLFYHAPAAPLNRKGVGEGLITGGNLAILAHLTGTPSEVDTEGKILFLEDVGEHLYNIDRMMMQLKRAGKLRHLQGLILGGFTELQDTERPFGQSVEEIIFDKVAEYDYPVAFHLPFGHQESNFTLMLGAHHRLTVTEQHTLLQHIR